MGPDNATQPLNVPATVPAAAPAYQCKYCKKTFARAEHLTRHERSRKRLLCMIADLE